MTVATDAIESQDSLVASVVPSGSSDCLTGSAIIYQTTVNDTDEDGLLDVWETNIGGPTGLTDPNGLPLPALALMGTIDNPVGPFHKDLFVEIGSMFTDPATPGFPDGLTYGGVEKPHHTHLPTSAALLKVGDAFATAPVPNPSASDPSGADGINVHFDAGDSVPLGSVADRYIIRGMDGDGQPLARGGESLDEMATVCQPVDGDPEFVCQFSQYPGTVGWKSGFWALKDALIGETFPDVLPEDDHPCDTPGHAAYTDIGPGGACERVFGRSRKDTFRYVFSAHALGVPKDHCLVTDPNDPNFGLSDPVCQMGDPFHEPNTFTGVGDFGGGDAMMTMGGFLNALGQPVGTDNQQAGTLMHELGHTMLLRHGGAPQNANCAPNYLSVMNYLFQLRGLVGGVTIDYSGQTIGDLDEGSLSEIAGLSGLMPGDPTEPMGSPPYGTAWYAPFRGIGTQATRHCNGTPLSLGEEAALAAGNGMVRVEGTDVGSGIDWDGSGDATATPNLDINFDGVINDGFPDPPNEAPESLLAGFNDWANLRLNQVGSRRNIGVYFLAGDYPYVGPASLDLGRLDFGRLDFGRLDFGRLDFGRLDFGRLDFGRLDFGRLDFGDMNIGDLGRLDFGRLDFGDFSPVDFDFGRLDFGVGAGDLGRGADGKGGGFGRLDFGRLDFGGGGEGGADAELTTLLAVAAGLLDPPTGLTAVEQTGPLGVLLNWEAPDARVTAYVVYREEGAEGEVTFTPNSAVGTVVRDVNDVLATTFFDATVVGGTTYTYYVAAQYVEGLEVNESASDTVTVDVSAPNSPPVLDAVGPQTVDELTLLSFTATAIDTDLPANTLTFSVTGAPAGAGIDPGSGVFTWTPTEGQGPGVFPFTVRVTDDGTGTLMDEESITVTVNEVNSAPTLGGVTNATIPELAPYQFQASSTDSDDPVQVPTFSLAGPGVPVGATITAAGAFSWTPAEDQDGLHSFSVVVTDGVVDTTAPISLTVSEVNSAPTLGGVTNATIPELAPYQFQASSTDSDDPVQVPTFSLAGPGVPVGATITAAGAFSWTPAEDQDGLHSFSVVVTDGVVDTTAAISLTVSEVNSAPTLGGVTNATIPELAPYQFQASSTDSDDPVQVPTFSLAGPGVPVGATTTAAGAFSWTPAEDQDGLHSFSVVVTDGV